ncbi:hypothetical protein [Nocardioides alkalitolerans]|uniref:hypothetical protein n=1 Tax=Nocardioides alkalitolerans TaxID=281714 RepID=UPI0004139669|nr:hypothetical protein [Nocardioides alkalitolerans]
MSWEHDDIDPVPPAPRPTPPDPVPETSPDEVVEAVTVIGELRAIRRELELIRFIAEKAERDAARAARHH